MSWPIVAKIGGSLFDLPNLRERLLAWVEQQGDRPILFVPGGGEAADVIRKLDKIHQLGDEKSHWLAIRMMSAHAHFLAELLHLPVVSSLPLRNGDRREVQVFVLDPLHFCQIDSLLEHSWQVTSDSIAARLAIVWAADLTLFKSVDLPFDWTWQKSVQAGLIDEAFPTIIENSGLNVTWINLRGQ